MKKLGLLSVVGLGILIGFWVYSLIISGLVDDYVRDYSDLGRSSGVFEFYDENKGGVYYFGSSSIKEDVDAGLMDGVNGFRNFNLGNPASTPIRRLVEMEKIILPARYLKYQT